MDSELRPRDVQARIRAGATVQELADSAGMSPEMVERFAGPVLAERAHVAATAMTSALRRSGEQSGHRTLRLVVAERLELAKVDLDAVDWDAYRHADGRWVVSAVYRVGEDVRTAEFLYQPSGRFSVTRNDEARGLVAEKPWPPAGEQDPDNEPTVDLSDELALVRALGEDGPNEPEADLPEADLPEKVATAESPASPASPESAHSPASPDSPESPASPESPDSPESPASPASPQTPPDPSEGIAETGHEEEQHVAAVGLSEDASTSQLDRLFSMFDEGSGEPVEATDTSEDTGPIYAGLSDAAAIPDVDAGGDFEPGPDTDIVVEPSLFDDDPQFAAPPKPAKRKRRRTKPTAVPDQPAEDSSPEPQVEPKPQAESEPTPVEAAEAAPTQPSEPAASDEKPASKPKSRKKKGRAAVPSWDEIMFGSPRRKD